MRRRNTVGVVLAAASLRLCEHLDERPEWLATRGEPAERVARGAILLTGG
jgi:hypothetical protein